MLITLHSIDFLKKSDNLQRRGAWRDFSPGAADHYIGYLPREVYGGDGLVEVESSNMDLVDELTEMMLTSSAYSTNPQTAQTTEKMLSSPMQTLG